MLTAPQCRELVAALRTWTTAAAGVVRTGHVTVADIKAIRLASAGADGLLTRMRAPLADLEAMEPSDQR